MQVVYYLDWPTDEYVWLARKSIARTRNVMPGVEVVHLTTTRWDGPDVGADHVVKVDVLEGSFYGYRRCAAHATMTGENLFLDVDCIVRRDVRFIFERDFDVAVCAKHLDRGASMPFNGGVCFSRCPQFWLDVAGKPEDHQGWDHTERRYSMTAMKDKYSVRLLDGDIYNYCPHDALENVDGKAIVHYKGARKAWMRAAA